MKLFQYFELTLYVLFILTEDAICDEEPAQTSEPDSTQQTDAPSDPSTLPSASLSSAPGWWVGPAGTDNVPETEGATQNEQNDMTNTGNWTTDEQAAAPPIILIRYPLVGPPEILVGSLIPDNGTYLFESENSTIESEFNVTEFPMFSVEDGIEEEIVFDTPNGTEVWIDDLVVIPEENITEGVESKSAQFETTDLTEEKEEEQIETANSLNGNTEESSTEENTSVVEQESEPQDSTTLPLPILQDTENLLSVK